MNKNYVYLATVIAVAVGLRIALPWDTVFGEYTKFTSPDAYYHMGIITKMAPVFPVPVQQYQLWDWLVAGVAWLLAWGEPTKAFIEHVAVILPPLMAGLTIFFVYVIGSRMFNRIVGLLAALTLAFIPGEFWHRTILGETDHHAAEVFLTTGVMVFIVLAVREAGWRRCIFATSATLFLTAYVYTWAGFPLFLMILVVSGLVVWGIYLYHWKNETVATVVMTVTLIGIVVVLVKLGMVGRISAGLGMNSLTLTTTAEAISAFSWGGFFGMVLLKCLLALILLVPLLFYKKDVNLRWMMMSWTLIVVVATFWQKRFDYYMAVPLALLIGLATWRAYVWLVSTREFRRITCRNLILACSSLVVIAFIIISAAGVRNLRVPTDDWQKALVWVRDNTPENALVIAWWDYGYWIEYQAERRVYINPGQPVIKTQSIARVLLSDTPPQYLPEGKGYLIIDRATAYDFIWAISKWAGVDNQNFDDDNILARRLYLGGQVGGITWRHGDGVKVFEYCYSEGVND